MGWPSSGNEIFRIKSRVTELPSTCYATVLWCTQEEEEEGMSTQTYSAAKQLPNVKYNKYWSNVYLTEF